ncbi:hypothetical protein BJI69_00300 [Luteibacter rhizovicinus DSM 16549]|uniref:Uncharacterized protein n=2 Tax=Luteibacter rhizovicinus TaxID=242606 RepID=A0A1L3EN48_9GAMM|nr:hypothetical protein BJI69_00300 [Luteibacter rhizovicinus DSM 16549]
MPLVWELTTELKNWLTPEKLRTFNLGWRRQGGGHPDAVIEDFIGVLIRDDLHYESILGYVENQSRREQGSSHYHGLYVWLVDMIYHMLYLRHINNAEYFERHLYLYDGIKGLSQKNSPLWVFSLNHDLIIEAVAARHSIPVSCGFEEEVVTFPRRDSAGNKIGDIRAEVLTKKTIEAGAMQFFAHGKEGINLLKIHGSLDTFTFRNGEDYLRLLPEKQSVDAVISTLRYANEELNYRDAAMERPVRAINEIAYRDDEGEMQFLRRSLLTGAFKFDSRAHQVIPKKILDHFRSNLNYLSRLVVIGYGFGDIHINQILRSWLEASGHRHLEIVDPFISAVPSFILHLAPQVTLTKATATHRLDSLGELTRDADQLAEREFLLYARRVGPEKIKEEMQLFADWEISKRTEALAERLRTLPLKNGEIDWDALPSSPEALALELVGEIPANHGAICVRFFDFKRVVSMEHDAPAS